MHSSPVCVHPSLIIASSTAVGRPAAVAQRAPPLPVVVFVAVCCLLSSLLLAFLRESHRRRKLRSLVFVCYACLWVRWLRECVCVCALFSPLIEGSIFSQKMFHRMPVFVVVLAKKSLTWEKQLPREPQTSIHFVGWLAGWLSGCLAKQKTC